MDKCECDQTGKLMPGMVDLYDEETELPYVNHKPGECKCTNGLKRYKRNGKIIVLCSCCNLLGDELQEDLGINK